MDEHKGHDTVSAAAEIAERRKELGASRREVQRRILDREKDVKALQQEVEAIDRCADAAVETIEKISADAKQQIRRRQKAEATHVGELEEKLRQEIAELSRKDAELERLAGAGDHTRFLHSYASPSRLAADADSSGVNHRPRRYAEDVTAAVSQVRGQIGDVLSEEWARIPPTGTEVGVSLAQAEPKTRDEFLQQLCKITPDENTAHKYIYLDYRWDGLQQIQHCYNMDFCYGHPDSFTDWCQVLCRENLTGCCYWEVEWYSRGVVVAAAYKDMSRRGDESVFGNDDKSWALERFDDGYEFRHGKVRTPISGPPSDRVGVYLDHGAGVLCFYSVVSETMTVLHRVHATFTRPLSAGFSLHVTGACAKIYDASSTKTDSIGEEE